jgi:autotransporter-associated beta strand protein
MAPAPSARAQGNVTLTDNGATVTLANGLVSVVIQKSNGEVTSITSSVYPNTNLIESSGIGLELTHIGNGPQSAPINDYWTDISDANGATYSVVTNNGQMVDIQIRNPIASGNVTLYPNGLWDWSIHHVMRAGDSGFYTYHVWRHNASQPQAYWDADSWQGYTNGALFSASPANNAWDFCGVEKNGVSIGASPPGSNSNGVPGEVVIMPMSTYYTQPTGQYYEAGWPIFTQPTGLTHVLNPTWTKYDWPSYLGPYTSYRNTWGVASDQVGLWHCNASSEWRNGGPTKLSGAMSGDYMYMDDDEGHGLGATNTTVAAGQVFTKVIGPFFTYVNTGTDHNALWADAQARGAQEVANWPYAWVNETEADYPRNRGNVTGQISATTGQSTANAVVILGDPVSAQEPDWIWQGCINYLFWTTADANGNFTIPKVRPGNYTLYSYVPGIFGELIQNNITVSANTTTNLGTISWSPPRAQNLLFQLGIPDHSTEEYRFGDLMKQFGLWWRYANEMGTNTLNFTVGQSNVANNWYYAQCIFALANGTYFAPVWNINFNLPSVPTAPVVLTVDLAGGYGTAFYTYVNGVNRTPSPYTTTGVYTSSGADIYRDVVQVGQWQQYTVTLPASAFVAGNNTLQLQVRQGGTGTTWDTTGYWPELLLGGLMYDALKLESGNQTTQMIPNGAYKINSAFNGYSVRVPNANLTTNAPVVEWPFQFLYDEQWRITDLGSDVYSIVNLNSGLALAVQNSSTAVGAVVVQNPYTGAANQQWHAMLNAAGGVAFINENSGLALDIPTLRSDYQNSVQFIQNTPNNSASQGWFATSPTYGPPPTPANVTLAAGDGQAALSWSPSERATSYVIRRGTSAGNETTTVAGNITTTTYTDSGLSDGVTYFYVVAAATSSGGASANSNEVSTTPLPPIPTAPAGLVAAVGNSQAVLSWSPSTGATGYTILRGLTSGGETTTVASNVTATTYTDTGLSNGQTYYYVVVATNLAGASGNSTEANVTPTANPPSAPTGLVATPGNGAAALSWTAATGAASYLIQRGTSSGIYTTNLTVNAATLNYTDTGLANGVTYYYAVAALNPNGTSANSNQVSVTPALNPPAVPTGLAATPGNRQVALSWNASAGATGYTLLRGASSGNYTVTVIANTTARTYTDPGLTNNTPYYYVVFATSLGGTSANSTQVSATPSRPNGTIPWTGNASSTWDLTSLNWQYGGISVNFQNGDSPVFGNAAPGNATDVFISTPITPASITVNATTLSYSFIGLGSINGAASLSFLGNNTTLIVALANAYTGQTLIQNGTLLLQSPGTLGTSKIVFNNGTLSSLSSVGLGSNSFSVAAGNTGAIVMNPAMTLGPVVGAGTMNITVSGGGNKAENFVGAWAGNFSGTLNLTGNAAGTQLTAYYNGGSPNFDGNLANATVNMDNLAIASWDNSGGNTLSIGALNGTAAASIIGSAYAGALTLSVGALNTNSTFAGNLTNNPGGGLCNIVKTGSGTWTLSGGNSSYTGPTTVSGGTLAVASLGLGGANSSIGASSNAPASLVLNGGALQYLGASTTTDRSFTIGANNATLDASGAGSVLYSNTTALAFAAANTACNFALAGNSTGNNTLAANLANNGSGRLQLTKTGPGSWILSGSDTATGNLTVAAGALHLFGVLNTTGLVEVKSGATLDLSGPTTQFGTLQLDANSTLTGNATILTGNVINNSTLTAASGGNFSINGNLINNGTVRLLNGTALVVSGQFTNNGILDLITGAQSLPANFVNHGVVLNSSVVQIAAYSLTGGVMQLSIQSYLGHNYQLQRSDTLSPPSWYNLGVPQTGTGAPLTFVDSTGLTGNQGYYRIVVAP